MVRLAFLTFMTLIVVSGRTQETYIRPGLIKTSATISPAYMLNRATENIYISGYAEYHLDKRLSFKGQTYWYVDGEAQSLTPVLHFDKSIRTYFGTFYHFNKKNWDKYIGFQPGLCLIKPVGSSNTEVIPSFAMTVGTSFFIWKYFHFFADVSYVNSTVRGFSDGGQRADELIISAGLGFNINTKKAE